MTFSEYDAFMFLLIILTIHFAFLLAREMHYTKKEINYEKRRRIFYFDALNSIIDYLNINEKAGSNKINISNYKISRMAFLLFTLSCLIVSIYFNYAKLGD